MSEIHTVRPVRLDGGPFGGGVWVDARQPWIPEGVILVHRVRFTAQDSAVCLPPGVPYRRTDRFDEGLRVYEFGG